MALKIFISSVFRELTQERQALRDEINKLQDLFVGMEFFGSDPERPADYCIRKVEESDLYIGVIGHDFGSTDRISQKSFTELEYEAALKKAIPCLIYFQNHPLPGHAGTAHTADPRLDAFKAKLRERHIVYVYEDLNDLKLQFLIDFIKLLRGSLFDKAGTPQRGSISADALHALTRGVLKEQIKTVGQDKYISELYITREAEKEIDAFIHSETAFLARANQILNALQTVSSSYNLDAKTEIPLREARKAMADLKFNAIPSVIAALKRAFYFEEVDHFINAINRIIVEPSSSRFEVLARELKSQLTNQPFVNRALLVSDFTNDLFSSSRLAFTNKAIQTHTISYRRLLRVFPSHTFQIVQQESANELILELNRLAEQNARRCAVLVDKAGTGKTNAACHLAETLANDHPVILLSGQLELSNEYDIEYHVQQRLEMEFRGFFSDWLPRVSPGLQAANKWLFILIDGINENGNPALMNRLLRNFIPKTANKRIKVILTCRDLFWDFFRETLEPHLFGEVIPLREFTESEWNQAVSLYFRYFNIQCILHKDAREALRNPLLLRFFCEAHRGNNLGKVNNLKLLSIFDLYLRRITRNIGQRHALLKPDAVLALLLSISGRMWKQQATVVNLSDTGISPREAGDGNSLYNLLLSENIILEETKLLHSTRKSVRFLYDEFMEYMVARSWVDELPEAKDADPTLERIVAAAIAAIESFPPSFGALLFLDQMLARNGSLVNKIIVRVSAMGKTLQPLQMIYAFEKVDLTMVDDALMAALEQFESTVRSDLKERLAPVILKILEVRYDHVFAKKYLNQVLEIDHERASAPQPGPREEKRPDWEARRPFGNPTPQAETIPSDPDEDQEIKRHVLPPARYHYTEETRLSAIGILVRLKDGQTYQTIEEGIRRMGRLDLHSALQALESLDHATDEIVYQAVADYLKINLAEYRIFCAFLLRQRYGVKPAELLVELLLDGDTRVHQYTARLFERRRVESALIGQVIHKINTHPELRPWHLDNLVRLLGKKAQFKPGEPIKQFESAIIVALTHLLSYPRAHIRLEAYRAILQYPNLINLQSIKSSMLQDPDIYIRTMAHKITAPTSMPGV